MWCRTYMKRPWKTTCWMYSQSTAKCVICISTWIDGQATSRYVHDTCLCILGICTSSVQDKGGGTECHWRMQAGTDSAGAVTRRGLCLCASATEDRCKITSAHDARSQLVTHETVALCTCIPKTHSYSSWRQAHCLPKRPGRAVPRPWEAAWSLWRIPPQQKSPARYVFVITCFHFPTVPCGQKSSNA